MVRWMCVMSLMDRSAMRICSLLVNQNVAEVVKHGRLRWFGHLEIKCEKDWVFACRNIEEGGEM